MNVAAVGLLQVPASGTLYFIIHHWFFSGREKDLKLLGWKGLYDFLVVDSTEVMCTCETLATGRIIFLKICLSFFLFTVEISAPKYDVFFRGWKKVWCWADFYRLKVVAAATLTSEAANHQNCACFCLLCSLTCNTSRDSVTLLLVWGRLQSGACWLASSNASEFSIGCLTLNGHMQTCSKAQTQIYIYMKRGKGKVHAGQILLHFHGAMSRSEYRAGFLHKWTVEEEIQSTSGAT